MNIDPESRLVREKTVLFAYTVYTAAVTTAAFVYRWESWKIMLLIVAALICCVLYGKKIKNYFFRAFCTSVAAWLTFSLELTRTDDFVSDMSIATVIIILLAVYCLPELTWVHTSAISIHLFYHAAVERDIPFDLHTIVRIAAVYASITLMNFMLKKHTETNEILRDNYESLHRAEKTKDDFLANISHEIRTPVNTICGISEIILREDMPEEVREEIYDIQTAGRSLLSIVTDILDFTELNSGKSEIVPVTYNITSTINDILNMTIASVADRGLELIVDCDADIPCGLVADEPKMRRAVMSILDNAVKFTREGGILFSVTSRKEDYGVNLVFTVKDTGIGMSDEALERLFTSYAQVDSKRSRQEGGIGLGMFITKTIVNRMGGFITVNSELGKGTEVQLVFPQKIVDDEPIVTVRDPEKLRLLMFVDLDMDKCQYTEIRDGYEKCIANLIKGTKVEVTSCRSLNEVKRRIEKDSFTHLFVSWEEYSLDKNYFDALAEHMNVVLVLERSHKESVSGPKLLCIYKPFYVLSIAAVLNGQFTHTSVGYHNSAAARFTAPTAKVMIVDDNLMNLKVTEGLLRPYKIKVDLAGSGRDALKKLDTFKPDIIFMDHMMPEMDGVEAFHRIRDRAGIYYQNVPVIALTANAVSGAREMFIREGFADYITKPIELSALERVLRSYIPESKIIKTLEVPDSPASRPAAGKGIVLDGIDTTIGIAYCNDNLEDYIDIVRVYYDIGIARIKDIRTHFDNRDIENYTILVHAVKSTSLNIGAVRLSAMAERLESAGKRRRIDEIENNTAAMLSEYERVLGVIGASPVIFPEVRPDNIRSETREVSSDELSASLDQLADALDTFENEKVASCMEELSKLSLNGQPIRELLSGVSAKASGFDFIGAAEELSELRRKVVDGK